MGETIDKARDPWAVVTLLLIVTALNYVDRLLPGILAEPIRIELNLSDTAIGIINGFGFLIVYAVSGIAISRFADKGHHAPVIAGSLGLWSVMTALGSLSMNGWQLGTSRLGVALGEAGSLPASQAFIARRFSEARRARALSILSLGSPAGTLLALMGGGALGAWLGWRWTFALMGLAGMLLAPIAFAMLRRHAPIDRGAPVTAAPGHWTDLFRTRSGTCIVIAGALVATGAYTGNAFHGAYLMRVHGLGVAQAGIQLGLAAGITGMVALLATGWAADRLAVSDPRWTLRVLMATMAVATPLLVVSCLAQSSTVAVVCIALGVACTHCYVPLTIVALYRLVPPHVRARTSATLLFATAVLGGAGPLLAGMASDAMAPAFGVDSLRYALLLGPLFTAFAVLFYLAAARSYRADMATVGGDPVPA